MSRKGEGIKTPLAMVFKMQIRKEWKRREKVICLHGECVRTKGDNFPRA